MTNMGGNICKWVARPPNTFCQGSKGPDQATSGRWSKRLTSFKLSSYYISCARCCCCCCRLALNIVVNVFCAAAVAILAAWPASNNTCIIYIYKIYACTGVYRMSREGKLFTWPGAKMPSICSSRWRYFICCFFYCCCCLVLWYSVVVCPVLIVVGGLCVCASSETGR